MSFQTSPLSPPKTEPTLAQSPQTQPSVKKTFKKKPLAPAIVEANNLRKKLMSRLILATTSVLVLLIFLAAYEFWLSPKAAPETPLAKVDEPVPAKTATPETAAARALSATPLPETQVAQVSQETNLVAPEAAEVTTSPALPAVSPALPPASAITPPAPTAAPITPPHMTSGKEILLHDANRPAPPPLPQKPSPETKPVAPISPPRTHAALSPTAPEAPQAAPLFVPVRTSKTSPIRTETNPVASPPAKPTPPEAARPLALAHSEPNLPPAQPSALASRLKSSYAIQAGVFTETKRAEDLQTKLANAGIPAALETRVHIGPFKNQAEANEAREKLKKMGIEAIIIAPPEKERKNTKRR